jgi:hypothetical protein
MPNGLGLTRGSQSESSSLADDLFRQGIESISAVTYVFRAGRADVVKHLRGKHLELNAVHRNEPAGRRRASKRSHLLCRPGAGLEADEPVSSLAEPPKRWRPSRDIWNRGRTE